MGGSTKLMTASGGGVILTPAGNTASDVTVNVPSQNCTLGIQGPAFSAYASTAQSTSSGVFTKIQFDTKVFDTNTNYSTSNYRFTPTVAGYYQINVLATVQTNSGGCYTCIYKNGSLYSYGNFSIGNATGWPFSVATATIYLNGTTDYVEGYIVQSTGGSLNTFSGGSYMNFNGAMVRAA